MISSCLLKRNDIYYFRLRIPLDIAPYFSRKEIWKSLKTKNYKSAKTNILKLLYTTERLFLHLRSGMYTDAQMKQLVKDYLHAYLNRCESLRSIAMVRYESEGQHSSEDISITRRLKEAGEIMGIKVLDHIIIGEGEYLSFVERGLL